MDEVSAVPNFAVPNYFGYENRRRNMNLFRSVLRIFGIHEKFYIFAPSAERSINNRTKRKSDGFAMRSNSFWVNFVTLCLPFSVFGPIWNLHVRNCPMRPMAIDQRIKCVFICAIFHDGTCVPLTRSSLFGVHTSTKSQTCTGPLWFRLKTTLTFYVRIEYRDREISTK